MLYFYLRRPIKELTHLYDFRPVYRVGVYEAGICSVKPINTLEAPNKAAAYVTVLDTSQPLIELFWPAYLVSPIPTGLRRLKEFLVKPLRNVLLNEYERKDRSLDEALNCARRWVNDKANVNGYQ